MAKNFTIRIIENTLELWHNGKRILWMENSEIDRQKLKNLYISSGFDSFNVNWKISKYFSVHNQTSMDRDDPLSADLGRHFVSDFAITSYK